MTESRGASQNAKKYAKEGLIALKLHPKMISAAFMGKPGFWSEIRDCDGHM
jgi:hypothetical protein